MNKENPLNVSLLEIANWQLNPDPRNKFQVSLPKIQRGFVWEPNKVINLWDSLLRGFPIGSLMLSEVAEEEPSPPENCHPTYWLLDGQQRATSIAMGYYNPWSAEQASQLMWTLKDHCPTLWLDLRPSVTDETKLFFPLLVTKSHPWGYGHSGEVLRWGLRSDALSAYKAAKLRDERRNELGDNYTKYPIVSCFPHQPAGLPVPMAFLIEADQSAVKHKIEDFQIELATLCDALPEAWKTQHKDKLGKVTSEDWIRLRKAVSQLVSRQIHLNYLSQEAAANDRFTNEDNSVLFVRLNSGGTPLEGEELIFSMFKSTFPQAKDAVEAAASGFISPSKLFSLFVRLVSAETDIKKLFHTVSHRDFKGLLQRDGIQFKERLKSFVQNEVEQLMKDARSLLVGSAAFCLPAPLATLTVTQSPEVLLVLLHWLKLGGRVEHGSENHRRMLGCLTAVAWFLPGNARKRRDAIGSWLSLAKHDFWSAQAMKTLFDSKDDPLPLFPPPAELESYLIKGVIECENYHWDQLGKCLPDHSIWSFYFDDQRPEPSTEVSKDLFSEKARAESNLIQLLGKLHGCKPMLLFAQRIFIQQAFPDFGQWEYSLQDSNRPWDWDHIFPTKKGAHSVNHKYKCWRDTIGNLCARKLSDNRADGADLPSEKLGMSESIRNDAFLFDDSEKGEPWKIVSALTHNLSNEDFTNVTRATLIRMVQIYRDWYLELRVHLLHDSTPG
jgi:hypothetical protein